MSHPPESKLEAETGPELAYDPMYELKASPLQVDYALLAKTVQAAVSEAHVDGLLKERILKAVALKFEEIL